MERGLWRRGRNYACTLCTLKIVFKLEIWNLPSCLSSRSMLWKLTVITFRGSLKSSLKYKEKADPKLAVPTLEKSTVMLFFCKINQKSTEPPYAHMKYQVIWEEQSFGLWKPGPDFEKQEKNIFTKGAFVQSNRPKQKQSNPASVVYRCTTRADIQLKQPYHGYA